MVIYNTTNFDGNEIKKSVLADNKFRFTKKMIVIAVLMILGFTLTFTGLKSSDGETSFTLGVSLVLFAMLYFLYEFIKYIRYAKSVDVKFEYEIKNGLVYQYTFHEEKLIVNIKIGNRNSKSEMFYNNLKKIINYNDMIVFVSNNDSYKCKKNGFKSKKEEELFFYGLNKHKIKVINKIKE